MVWAALSGSATGSQAEHGWSSRTKGPVFRHRTPQSAAVPASAPQASVWTSRGASPSLLAGHSSSAGRPPGVEWSPLSSTRRAAPRRGDSAVGRPALASDRRGALSGTPAREHEQKGLLGQRRVAY